MDFLDSLKKEINADIGGIHTAMPAIILSFDHTTCTAKVQPLVTKVLSSGDAVDYPILCNVPVFFPRMHGMQISFPVGTGDGCLLIVCEEARDSWHSMPKKKQPFSLNNCIALVGLADAALNKDDVFEAWRDNKIVIRGDVKVYGKVYADDFVD